MKIVKVSNANSFVAILLVVITLGCKKDKDPPLPPPPPPSEEVPVEVKCIDFDSATAECVVGPFHHDEEPAYFYPSINPNNPNEFVCFARIESGKQVFKVNMQTGEKQMLQEDVHVINRMDWGAAGWITFSTLQWKVFKIKEDGSGIAQISFTPRDIGPEFNPSGDKIIYARNMEYGSELNENPDLRHNYKLMIVDLNGNAIDSFCRVVDNDPCYPWGYCSWSNDGQFLAAEHGPNNDGSVYGLGLYSLKGELINMLYEPESTYYGESFIADIEWHPDNNTVYFVDGYGIKVVDKSGGEVKMIKESCDSRHYDHISISPSGDFMIAQRTTAEVDGCDIYNTVRIVKMDMNGSNEEVIEIK